MAVFYYRYGYSPKHYISEKVGQFVAFDRCGQAVVRLVFSSLYPHTSTDLMSIYLMLWC